MCPTSEVRFHDHVDGCFFEVTVWLFFDTSGWTSQQRGHICTSCNGDSWQQQHSYRLYIIATASNTGVAATSGTQVDCWFNHIAPRTLGATSSQHSHPPPLVDGTASPFFVLLDPIARGGKECTCIKEFLIFQSLLYFRVCLIEAFEIFSAQQVESAMFALPIKKKSNMTNSARPLSLSICSC